jgi:predicted nucleic acid-binding protein
MLIKLATSPFSPSRLGYKHTIPLADGVILATACLLKAVIWTQDADFKGLKDVQYKKR